jgi:hypothetical protein
MCAPAKAENLKGIFVKGDEKGTKRGRSRRKGDVPEGDTLEVGVMMGESQA